MSSHEYRLAAEQVRLWERTDHQIEFEADKTREAIAGLEFNIKDLEEAIQKMNDDLKVMRPNTESGLEDKVAARKERQVKLIRHQIQLLRAIYLSESEEPTQDHRTTQALPIKTNTPVTPALLGIDDGPLAKGCPRSEQSNVEEDWKSAISTQQEPKQAFKTVVARRCRSWVNKFFPR